MPEARDGGAGQESPKPVRNPPPKKKPKCPPEDHILPPNPHILPPQNPIFSPKIPPRSWQSVYCVLRGGNLSVYKDAKSASHGAPYHGEPPACLRGAHCHPATDYKKRKHVFKLGYLGGVT